MANIVIIGAQWGDEGKGKIVDWLSDKADVVARFQGGNNAGHTIIVDNEVFKLRLLPSGIVRKDTISVLGNGVVLDPWALLEEIDEVTSKGIEINPKRLKIAGNINLNIPDVHKELDLAREGAAKDIDKIGTTGRGIGPTYEDKVARRGIRLVDLTDLDNLKNKVDKLLNYHNRLRESYGLSHLKVDDICEKLAHIAPKITPYISNLWHDMYEFDKQNKSILFEGAQGTFLDIDHGTYPYVTSSNTVASNSSTGAAIGMSKINHVLAIIKAYTTRVGFGPFPSELQDEIGQEISTKGHEFGTVTGRARRCGWLDLAMTKQAMWINGATHLGITKLDVLDGFDEVKVCIGYKKGSQELDVLPQSLEECADLQPIYKTFAGWPEGSSKGKTDFNQLHENAQNYLRFIAEELDIELAVVSVGADRNESILLSKLF